MVERMTRRLEGQTALVTGAGRGIGRAIALTLAAEGARLALVARSEQQLAQVVDACLSAGASDAVAFAVDLTLASEVETMATAAVERFGGVDILVNNAGMFGQGGPDGGDPDEWDRMIALNLSTPMRLTRRFAKGMIERQHGLIVNVGSLVGVQPMAGSAAYAATKYGMRGWSLNCYEDLHLHGIKVVLLNPAFVDTEMVRTTRGVRFERMLQPSDLAEAMMLAVTTSPMCCPQEITLRTTLSVFEGDA